jgi:hypothetical protein
MMMWEVEPTHFELFKTPSWQAERLPTLVEDKTAEDVDMALEAAFAELTVTLADFAAAKKKPAPAAVQQPNISALETEQTFHSCCSVSGKLAAVHLSSQGKLMVSDSISYVAAESTHAPKENRTYNVVTHKPVSAVRASSLSWADMAEEEDNEWGPCTSAVYPVSPSNDCSGKRMPSSPSSAGKRNGRRRGGKRGAGRGGSASFFGGDGAFKEQMSGCCEVASERGG